MSADFFPQSYYKKLTERDSKLLLQDIDQVCAQVSSDCTRSCGKSGSRLQKTVINWNCDGGVCMEGRVLVGRDRGGGGREGGKTWEWCALGRGVVCDQKANHQCQVYDTNSVNIWLNASTTATIRISCNCAASELILNYLLQRGFQRFYTTFNRFQPKLQLFKDASLFLDRAQFQVAFF